MYHKKPKREHIKDLQHLQLWTLNDMSFFKEIFPSMYKMKLKAKALYEYE